MNEEIKNVKLMNIAFITIIIMQAPYYVAISVLKQSSLLLPLVSMSYIVEMSMMIYAVSKYKHAIINTSYASSIIYLLIQSLAFISNIIIGIDSDYRDYVNVVIKTANYIVFYIMFINIHVNRNSITIFMKYFIIYSIVCCIINIAMNYNHIGTIQYLRSSYQINIKSIFVNRNQFAAVLLLGVFSIDYYYVDKKIDKVGILLLTILIANIIFTMSRGGALALIAYYISKWVLNKNKLKHRMLSVVVVIMFIGIINSSEALYKTINRLYVRADVGTGRAVVWEIGSKIWYENNIVTGIGANTAISMAKSTGMKNDQFHSFYIETLASGGILELLFLVVLVIKIMLKYKNSTLSNSNKHIYYSSMVSIIFIAGFESISIFSMGYVDTLYTIYFITIPMLFVGSYKDKIV